MQAIGIDIGTTSICGILIDAKNGNIIHTVTKANTSTIPSEQSYEKLQSPDVIYQTAEGIIEELYKLSEGVRVIGVTGQMHGIVYVNANGNAVSPLYTWQDERGNLPYNNLQSYAQYLNSYAGYGNVTNFYNKTNGLVPRDSRHFCTIHDYVAMRLSKKATPLVHISDAASLGLFDIEKGCFTVNEPLLPDVTDKAEILGEWKNIPVCVAIGDNQASFIGCGCGEGSVLVNIGTGSQVSWVSHEKEASQGTEIRPLCENKCLSVGSSLCGGRAFAILKNFFEQVILMSGNTCDALYDKMEKAGEERQGTPPIFETLFCGTRDDGSKRASIKGLSIDNFTPGNMVYSCYHGMVMELYELYQPTEKCTELIGSGNGIRKNPLLKSIIEDLFKMQLKIPVHCEEASFGAAMFALTAVGVYENLSQEKHMIKYE